MGIDVLFQAVYLRLLIVTKITYAQRHATADIDVNHELLSKIRSTDECRGDYIVVVVAAREHLVVRLSVRRTERKSDERKLHFIADGKMVLPQIKPIGCGR